MCDNVTGEPLASSVTCCVCLDSCFLSVSQWLVCTRWECEDQQWVGCVRLCESECVITTQDLLYYRQAQPFNGKLCRTDDLTSWTTSRVFFRVHLLFTHSKKRLSQKMTFSQVLCFILSVDVWLSTGNIMKTQSTFCLQGFFRPPNQQSPCKMFFVEYLAFRENVLGNHGASMRVQKSVTESNRVWDFLHAGPSLENVWLKFNN